VWRQVWAHVAIAGRWDGAATRARGNHPRRRPINRGVPLGPLGKNGEARKEDVLFRHSSSGQCSNSGAATARPALAAAGRGRFACYHPGVNDEHIKTIATIYAAVVATGALLLSLKTWLDSGVKLRLSLMADGMVTGGDPRHDEKDLVILTVTKRRSASPSRLQYS
jgi:hypothetical protein